MLLSLAEIYFPSPTKSESTNSLKFRFSLAPDEGYSVYRGICPSLAPQGQAGENPGNKVAACRVIEEDMKQIGHFRVSPGPLSVCESSKNLNGVS